MASRKNSKAFFNEEWQTAFDYAEAEGWSSEDVKAAQKIGNFSANRFPTHAAFTTVKSSPNTSSNSVDIIN
jgi:hypothetical protein